MMSKTFKLGRVRPVARAPRLSLSRYLKQVLPTPPASVDYSGLPAVRAILADIFLNDRLGCCVISAGYHIVGLETGNAGTAFHASSAQILADYEKIGHYDPSDASTDQGCNEQDALNYWRQHGFANGTKPLGWLAIDGHNKQEVMTAIWLFENLLEGVELPDPWVKPFPQGDGFTWDVAGPPNLENGHAFPCVGYDSVGVKIDTWGMLGTMTWPAVEKYATSSGSGELYVLLTPDQLTRGQSRAPNGLNWADLAADFDALGGNVPVPKPPVPVPAPTPAPQPPKTTATLLQAETWTLSALSAGPSVLTRSQAESIVLAGLKKNWPTK